MKKLGRIKEIETPKELSCTMYLHEFKTTKISFSNEMIYLQTA